MTLSNSIFTFFKELKVNNNREWFLKNKSIFKQHEVSSQNFWRRIKKHIE